MSNQFVDSEVQIDLTDVREFGGGGGPQLPPGEYVFDIVTAKQDTSSTNNSVWKVEFIVAEGEHAGKKMTNSYSLQSQALGRIKQLALSIGAPLNTIKTSDYVGARMRATIIHVAGKAQVGADGTPMEPRIFANIANERALETQEEAPPPPPPVTRGKAANGTAARRA